MRAILIKDQNHHKNELEDIIGQLQDIEIIAQSHTANDASIQCALHSPEFVIIDTLANDEDIPEIVARIKQDFPTVKVFVLTCGKDDRLAVKVKEAGADLVARRTISLNEWRQLIRYAQKHYRVYSNPYAKPNDPQ